MTARTLSRRSWLGIVFKALGVGLLFYIVAAGALGLGDFELGVQLPTEGPPDLLMPIKFGGQPDSMQTPACALYAERKTATVDHPLIVDLRVSTCMKSQNGEPSASNPVFYPNGDLLQATLTSPAQDVDIVPDKHNLPQPGPPPDPSWQWTVTVKSPGEHDFVYTITSVTLDGKTEQYRSPAIPFTVTAENQGKKSPDDPSVWQMLLGKDGVTQTIINLLTGLVTLATGYLAYRTAQQNAIAAALAKPADKKPVVTLPKKKKHR